MMKLILVLLLVGLVVAFLQRQKNPELAKLLMALLGVLALMVSGFSMYRTVHPEGAMSYDLRFERALGYKLGQAVAKALPQGGEVYVEQVLLGEQNSGPMQDLVKERLEGIKEGFGSAKLTIVGRGPDLNPTNSMAMMEFDQRIPRSEFTRVLTQHPKLAAIVSFQGVPDGNPAEAPANTPLLFVNGTLSDATAVEWLKSGKLPAFVTYKASPDVTTKPARRATLDEIFNLRFVTITADNVDAMMATLFPGGMLPSTR